MRLQYFTVSCDFQFQAYRLLKVGNPGLAARSIILMQPIHCNILQHMFVK